MARRQMFLQFLLLVFAEWTLGLDWSPLTVHEGPKVAGVFMVTEGGEYAFNFTEAIATCQYLNVTIATKVQMEQAQTHGLETCKFGWIAEQIAVIPRMTAVQTCGSSKTGVVSWHADPQKKFGVYCFNASDSKEIKSSTSDPQIATSDLSMVTLLTQKHTTPTAPTTAVPPIRLVPSVPPTASITAVPSVPPITPVPSVPPIVKSTTEAPSVTTERTRSFSTFTSRIQTSMRSRPKATSSSRPPRLLTWLPADVTVTLALHTIDSSVSSTPSSTVKSKWFHWFGASKIELIVLCIVVLIFTVGGAVAYYRWGFLPWHQGQQKDDVETEMWKQTGSEMDLHIQHEQEEDEEEEEADRKYASDATLCMKPDFKTNC